MSDKLFHNSKTSLSEESKLYLPTVKEFYPHLDDLLTDRIAKYCALYSKGTDKASIRQAINDFEEVFDTELTSQYSTSIIEYLLVYPLLKYLYIIDYWIPFPTSEYGGVLCVISETESEVAEVIRNEDSIPQKEGYENLMLKNIQEAEKLPLSGDFESGIISAFIT